MKKGVIRIMFVWIFVGIIFLCGLIIAIIKKDILIVVIALVAIIIILLISGVTSVIINKNIVPDVIAEEEIVDIVSLDLKNEYYLGVENKKELYWFVTQKDNNITGLKSAPISKSTINSNDKNKRTYVIIYHKTYDDILKFFFGSNLHDEQEYIFYIPKDTVYYNFEID